MVQGWHGAGGGMGDGSVGQEAAWEMAQVRARAGATSRWRRMGDDAGKGKGEGCLKMARARRHGRWHGAGDGVRDSVGWETVGAGERASHSLLKLSDTLPTSSVGMGG